VGDVVLGLASSGLHSNGYSLVRNLVANKGLNYRDQVADFSGRSLGEVLLEPTRLYTGVLNQLLESELGNSVSTMSHITGGGIAANLSRVLPAEVSLDVERASWSPSDVFRVLASWGNYKLTDLESTWNLGLGFALVVRSGQATEVARFVEQLGISTWQLGIVESTPCNSELPGYITQAKGIRGGAVRMVGNYGS